MKPIKIVFLLSLLSSFTLNSFSQGCSDAGFCNLSSFKAKLSDSLDYKYQNQFKVGGSHGKADHKITVYGGFMEYHKDVDSSSSIDIRLTYLAHLNHLVTSYGLSDLFLNANWLIVKDLILTTGIKLALTDGDARLNELAIPMDFQLSLGTLDVILGFAYKYKGFQLFLGGQQPLNKNKNEFLTENYNLTSEFRDYQSTNGFKRKGDILLRVAYPIALGNKFIVTPSLLPIYHLGDDEFTNIDGNKVSIVGSKGLTLNANLFIDFALNKMNKISLSLAAPLVTRKVRPDGLTRKYVVGLEYAIRF